METIEFYVRPDETYGRRECKVIDPETGEVLYSVSYKDGVDSPAQGKALFSVATTVHRLTSISERHKNAAPASLSRFIPVLAVFFA